MAADFAFAFGSYTYGSISGLTITRYTEERANDLQMARAPGMWRAYVASSLPATRRFTLEGIIVSDTATNLRTAWDAFLAAHGPGAVAYFYPHSDRYRIAQVESITKAEFTGGRQTTQIDFAVNFVAGDPLTYSTTTTTTSSLASGGTVTNGGGAPTWPTFTMVVSSIGSSGYINITNSTTGHMIQIVPSATGTYTINMYAQTVTRGGTDAIANMNSEFWSLAAGANTIAVALYNSATISSLSCAHNDAWY